MAGTEKTDPVEWLFLLLAAMFVILFIISMGYVPVEAVLDVQDILPQFESLGLWGQFVYLIVTIASLIGAGLRRVGKL